MSEQVQLWDAGAVRTRDARGRKPTCHCGTCHTCNHRAYKRDYMRAYYHGMRRPRIANPKPAPPPVPRWTPDEDALLGTDVDRVIAEQLGRSWRSVYKRRTRLGIPRVHKTTKGYHTTTLAPDDPLIGMARSDGGVQMHRLTMARHIGRPLAPDEFVHHRNGVKTDNRIENLELWALRQHPSGQRVSDLVAWAREILARYGDEADAHQIRRFFAGEE